VARSEFGGVMAAWVVSSASVSDTASAEVRAVTLPTEAMQLQIYDAPGGSQVTDFLDEGGQPVTQITVPPTDPYIPRFSGPDGAASLWAQADGGRWLPIPRWDDGEQTFVTEAEVQALGDARYVQSTEFDEFGDDLYRRVGPVADWKRGRDYAAGALVRHRSTVWYAAEDVTGMGDPILATRTNLVTNTLRVNSTGWTVPAGTTPTMSGSALKLTLTAQKTVGQALAFETTPQPAVAGEVYAASIKFTVPAAAPASVPMKASLMTDGADTGGLTVTVPPGGSQVATVTHTIPAGATNILLAVWAGGTLPIGTVVEVSEPIREKAATVGPFFDGDTADTEDIDYAWNGTPNASTSTATTETSTFGDTEPGVYSGWREQGEASKFAPTRTDRTQIFAPTANAVQTDFYPGCVDEQTRSYMLSQNQAALRVSRDDGQTWTVAHTFTDTVTPVIVSCIVLDNGEALVATKPVDNLTGFKVWLSDGFQAGPTTATWTQVHQGTTPGAYPTPFSWSHWGPRVMVSEYGPKIASNGTGVNARYVWMSEDYGRTWKLIYDLGALIGRHVHGVCVDPYWDRLWITTGDDQNSTIYSDDLGAAWHTAEFTSAVDGPNQVTSILAMPQCVLFGTDGTPNGVLRISRSQGKHTGAYEMEVAYLHNDVQVITHVSQTVFRARRPGDDAPGVLYFAPGVNDAPAFIVTTPDGYTFHKVWEDTIATPGGHNGNAYGPTASGRLVITQPDGRYGSGRSLWRGPMPGAY
jgi:hypothetical protein